MISEAELLEHALLGCEARRNHLSAAIEEVRARLLLNHTHGLVQPVADPPRRRRMSAEGRANIVAALKRRWANARRLQGSGRAR